MDHQYFFRRRLYQREPAILIRTLTAITSIRTRTGTIPKLIRTTLRKLRSAGSIATSARLACIKLCGRWLLGWCTGLPGRRRWRYWFSRRFGIRNGLSPICLFLESARLRG